MQSSAPLSLNPQPSSPLPNSSLSPSFNQQPCFDFHLRLFVAHCTFGSFQWHFNVPTRTAAAPFHQGLLTAVLASSPPSSTKLPSPTASSRVFRLFCTFCRQTLSKFIIEQLCPMEGGACALYLSLSLPLCMCVCEWMLCVCLFVCVCVCACQVLFQCAIASRKSSLLIQELLMSWIFIKFWAWFDFIAYFTLTSTPSAIKAITTTTPTSRVLRQWPGYTQCTCKSFNELLLVWYTSCAVFLWAA